MNKSELQLAHDATTEEFQIMFSAHHISWANVLVV
jgi:hypothetical protein